MQKKSTEILDRLKRGQETILTRILVFTTAYRPMIGGSEMALEEVVRRLPDIFFDIVTPKHKSSFNVFETGSNSNIHRIGVGAGILDKIVFPVFGFFKAVSLMKNYNYNSVHAYQASYGGGAAWLVKLFSPRLPFILTMQEGKKLDEQSAILNWFRELIIRKADTITAISTYLKEYVQKISKNKEVFLIPNGVDLKKFQIPSHKLQADFKFNEKDHTIITVSRLVPKNGLADLIRAFKILDASHLVRKTKLLVIGGGPQREELFKLTEELGLKDRVEFLGSISNEKIYEYLASSSVFVRPSLSEGLGIAFLEAMASGVPIIGTPVGGITDFLKDPSTHSGQATGLFCKPGDPKDIADKVKMILSDDELRNRLITNGRKLVEEKYDWNNIAEKFRGIYERV